MKLQQFFSTHHWWGKIIGAGLGYLILGPLGAIFGIFIGNLFDHGLTQHFTRPHWQYTAEKRTSVQKIFFESAFSVMGHIAKADGRVTEEQIKKVVQLMDDLRLTKTQRQLAQAYFRMGKKTDFNLWRTLSLLREATADNPALLNLFFDLEYQTALIGGLSLKKQRILNAILSFLGFAPLYQQHSFYEEFNYQPGNQQSSQRQSSTNGKQNHFTGTKTDHAFGILGLTSAANKQDVKRAYRKLISQHHPDKLIAKGLPESMIKIANEKTQKITKAYEQICSEKGW